MPDVPTNDVLLPALESSIRAGRCVAFIGAGLSVPDYPTWPALIDLLRTSCDLTPSDTATDDPLLIAEVARSKNRDAYHEALRTSFSRKDIYRAARRYHLLCRIPSKSYVTTNFDPLLVDVFSLHRNVTLSAYPWLQAEHHGKRELYFAHGRIDPDDPLALRKSS